MDKKILDKQAQHWENTFINRPETFGVSPSAAAIRAAEIFNKKSLEDLYNLSILCYPVPLTKHQCVLRYKYLLHRSLKL